MYKLFSIIAIIFFIFILWVIYIANTGSGSVFFDFIYTMPNGDKYGHMGLFGFLTFAAIIGLKFKSFPLGKLNVYWGAGLVIIFVVAEELSQSFIPSRTFDLTDLAADAIGISSAIGLAYLVNIHFIKR